MDSEIMPTSPDGRYTVRTTPWEARNTLWVYPPEVVAQDTGRVVFRFADTHWSADGSTWESASRVRLALRKYPGGQPRGSVVACIDCALGTGEFEGRRMALAGLEAVLDDALQAA